MSAVAVLWNQIEVRRQQEISSQVVFPHIWRLVCVLSLLESDVTLIADDKCR